MNYFKSVSKHFNSSSSFCKFYEFSFYFIFFNLKRTWLLCWSGMKVLYKLMVSVKTTIVKDPCIWYPFQRMGAIIYSITIGFLLILDKYMYFCEGKIFLSGTQRVLIKFSLDVFNKTIVHHLQNHSWYRSLNNESLKPFLIG